MRYLTALIFSSVLAACVSRPVIDTSSKDQACAQSCSKEYDDCTGEPTMMPIRRNRACARILTYCDKACPEKK